MNQVAVPGVLLVLILSTFQGVDSKLDPSKVNSHSKSLTSADTDAASGVVFVQHDFRPGSSKGTVHKTSSLPPVIENKLHALPSMAPTSEPTYLDHFPHRDQKKFEIQVPSFVTDYHKHLMRMDHNYGGGMDNRGLRGAGKVAIEHLLAEIAAHRESECDACCMWGTLTLEEQRAHKESEMCTDLFRAVDFDPCGLVQEFSCVPNCQPHAAMNLAQHMCSCIKDSCKSNVVHSALPPGVHKVVTVAHRAHIPEANHDFMRKYKAVEP
jgi:hypothetical protein